MSAPDTMDGDPIAHYRAFLAAAAEGEVFDATRVALATADAAGRPSVRFVLVKAAGPDGFAFYSDYRSRKAADLEVNPYAALAWHWSTIGVQVRAEGRVERLASERSDAYFATRPHRSRLGAWASHQSAPLADRTMLESAVATIEGRFGDGPITRPDHWGGYLLVPETIEFWFNRDDRLHDRFVFARAGETWDVTRISP